MISLWSLKGGAALKASVVDQRTTTVSCIAILWTYMRTLCFLLVSEAYQGGEEIREDRGHWVRS